MPYFNDRNYWGLILGGSSGIGLAAARKLAAEGMHLCIVHRDRRQATQLFLKEVEQFKAQGVQCLTFNLDALRDATRDEVIFRLQQSGVSGQIRLVLHAVSRGNLKLLAPLPESPGAVHPMIGADPGLLQEQDLRATLEAMALSLFDWVKALFEAKLFAADARILGLTSEGNRKAWRSYAAVSAAKAALESICRSIALEFAPYGIRCNVLQPGVTDTPSLRMIPGSEQLKANARLRNPFQRLTQPEDVANVIYLLCRDESSWINGALIPVDGGEKNS